MVAGSWIQRSIYRAITIVFALFYASSYTTLVNPNIAWAVQFIGLFGILESNDNLKWYFLHFFTFSTAYWLIYPFYNLIHMTWIVSIITTLMIIATLSLCKAMPMYFISKKYKHFDLVLCGIYWSLYEYLQIHILHLSWLIFAQPQGASPFQLPISAILYPVIILTSYQILKNYFFILVVLSISYNQIQEHKIKVALIQGNIDKVSPYSTSYINRKKIHDIYLEDYKELSSNAYNSDLIIWPECILGSVYPIYFRELSSYINNFNFNVPLILGASFAEKDYNNVSMLIDSDKNITIQNKKHYVPFAESTPSWLIPIISKIIPNYYYENIETYSGYDTFEVYINKKIYKILVIICYDSSFVSFEKIPDSDMIVVLSENIWFNSQTAQHQQLLFAQLIAKKHKKTVIVVSNNGFTGLINNNGYVVEIMPNNLRTLKVLQI